MAKIKLGKSKERVELFRDDLADLINEYLGKGFVAKDGNLFFDNDEIYEKYSSCANELENLIRYATGKRLI